MMHVKIYHPTKSAMQSGRGKLDKVILEPDQVGRRVPEPVMGWAAGLDTLNQVRMTFLTIEAAVAHAQAQGWTYTIGQGAQRRVKARNYTDHFKPTLTLETLGVKGSAQESC
jgi:hypothetical protein